MRAIETTYQARRSYRWAGWLAGFLVKVARPEGVRSLKMAVFENQDFSRDAKEGEFELKIATALAGDWRPIVRVASKRDGERTHIFAHERGKDVELLIVNVEATEAVVLLVKMNEARLAGLADDPATFADSFRGAHPRDPVRPSAEAAGPPVLQRRESSVLSGSAKESSAQN